MVARIDKPLRFRAIQSTIRIETVMVSSEIKSSFPMMRDSTMGNGALAENLKEDDKTVIWRPHEEKYRTSEWYTGSGQITTADEGLSFEVTAVYQLKSEASQR